MPFAMMRQLIGLSFLLKAAGSGGSIDSEGMAFEPAKPHHWIRLGREDSSVNARPKRLQDRYASSKREAARPYG